MSGPKKTTEEIVAELQQGRDREENFRLLYERHYGQLFRFFRNKLLPPEDCRDLIQKVFISVYRGLGGFRHDSQFETWLFKIALNAYVSEIEHRRAGKRDGVQVSLDGERSEEGAPSPLHRIADERADPAGALLDQEKLEKMREAMRELPEQMRRCVQLRLVKELSYQEIAAVMGVSINTVKAHLHQSQKVLREKLSKYFGALEV
jgi:RNA polymerase sigma-70 factor (ECF subfamily)